MYRWTQKCWGQRGFRAGTVIHTLRAEDCIWHDSRKISTREWTGNKTGKSRWHASLSEIQCPVIWLYSPYPLPSCTTQLAMAETSGMRDHSFLPKKMKDSSGCKSEQWAFGIWLVPPFPDNRSVSGSFSDERCKESGGFYSLRNFENLALSLFPPSPCRWPVASLRLSVYN